MAYEDNVSEIRLFGWRWSLVSQEGMNFRIGNAINLQNSYKFGGKIVSIIKEAANI